MKSCGLRGLKVVTPDGKSLRPDMIIGDDPQTKDDAVSPRRVDKILATFNRDLAMSRSRFNTLAMLVNITMYAPGDVADSLMDRKRFPSWRGDRVRMVKEFPDAWDEFWLGEYAREARMFDPNDKDGAKEAYARAVKMLRKNWDRAHKGAVMGWDHCYTEDGNAERPELSALHHAANVAVFEPDAFATECQNEPPPDAKTASSLTTERLGQVVDLTTRCGVLPPWATKATAFVDVQQRVLYWMVCAWREDMRGMVVDYGCWPKQAEARWTSVSAKRTIALAAEMVRKKGVTEGDDAPPVGNSPEALWRWVMLRPLFSGTVTGQA